MFEKIVSVMILFGTGSTDNPRYVNESEDFGPWSSAKSQKYLKNLIPEGVPFTKNLKFYNLRQVSQSLSVTNGSPLRQILPADPQDQPWQVSGGMHWSPRNEWRNVTALDIPEGKHIRVWTQYVTAGATQPVPKLFWSFPKGTKAYDILIRTPKRNPRLPTAKEHIFEVRIHEKQSDNYGDWDDGTIYRPNVSIGQLEKSVWQWHFDVGRNFSNLADIPAPFTLRASSNYYVAPHIDKDVGFVPSTRSKLVVDNGGFTPSNYYGTGARCMACHSHAGMSLGYAAAVRGSDGRFSWHPLSESDTNYYDTRWPIKKLN